ncbi:MAG: type I DNA topoisomerase [Patescibacteria group bacterium]|nr:type I DNA topoisomerase [Patescibacteria group bacterium]
MKNLVIVESPTKTKTISKYLDPSFEVHASVGHIRDLPKNNKKAIDISGGFIPHYEISKGKEKIVEEIKKLAKKAENIYLATDPDREGESIAWHIKEACDLKNPKRIVFYEITEGAVKEALEHPRDIDLNLLKAQEARRVLDRLVGYDLSGLIWKKVRYGLSAGRVQSPALRILMEREREIRAFIPEKFWVITGRFSVEGGSASGGETNKKKILFLTCEKEPKNIEEVQRIIKIARAHQWQIVQIKETEVKRSPKPPFITSTLQQAASSRLGYSPSRTMSIAQKLYEQGFISYMRTDSPALSKDVLGQIYHEIESTFGKEYLEPRTYKTKSKSAQEAHEAIRPSKIAIKNAGSTEDQKKLYTLIRERTIASQMANAKILRTKVSANITEGESIPNFSISGSVILFPGWLRADPRANGEEIELPKLKEKEPLKLNDIGSEEKQTEPLARYTEAGLIKELEKREIGRPSTYATIISTLLARGYVEKEERSLKPTDTGDVVSTFLEQNFTTYISDSFTAEMENDLDEIALGKRDYTKTLKDFYGPFSKDVKHKTKDTEKITTLGEDRRFKCPLDEGHGTMLIKLGRTGKFLSCREFPDCLGARKIDGNTMEPPKETGESCPKCPPTHGGKLIEREGRFGKFIACSNYPKCKYVKKSEEEETKNKTGITCPECNKGELTGRRGRFGVFYSCSNYPDCKFIIKSRPTGNKCNICGSLIMEGTKTIPERCSNKTCLNHNPHKLKK